MSICRSVVSMLLLLFSHARVVNASDPMVIVVASNCVIGWAMYIILKYIPSAAKTFLYGILSRKFV